MGFKVDSSFLRFLTMGALGVRRVAQELRERGFEPIELERYCMSNKLWATKVKRLRLPDLLCVRTGLRVEARAKSDLKIRMSDALQNTARAWDAGLRNNDLIALIACPTRDSGPEPAGAAVYFAVEALRKSLAASKLGPSKSASEGAERDRTWPAIVPSRSGRVLLAGRQKLIVMMEGDGEPPRKQTYALNGKHAYVAEGDRFMASISMLAGAPRMLADLSSYSLNRYNPLHDLTSNDPLDRHAAAKALRFRDDLHLRAVAALENALPIEGDIRVALEMASSAAALGSAKGQEYLSEVLRSGAVEMSMEAILILTELKTGFAHGELRLRRATAVFMMTSVAKQRSGDSVKLV